MIRQLEDELREHDELKSGDLTSAERRTTGSDRALSRAERESLFAAMDVASGVTISNCYRQHRHQEFLRFLHQIEDSLPKRLDVHLVMGNYGTHKVPKVSQLVGPPPALPRPLHAD